MTARRRPFSQIDKVIVLTVLPLMGMMVVSMPAYHTYTNLLYASFGKTADATVIHIGERQVRGSLRSVLNIDYSFQNDTGKQQIETDVLPSGSDVQKGKSIKVEYVPGSNGMSRVKGNKPNLMFEWFTLGILALLFFGGTWFVWKMPTTPRIPEFKGFQ